MQAMSTQEIADIQSRARTFTELVQSLLPLAAEEYAYANGHQLEMSGFGIDVVDGKPVILNLNLHHHGHFALCLTGDIYSLEQKMSKTHDLAFDGDETYAQNLREALVSHKHIGILTTLEGWHPDTLCEAAIDQTAAELIDLVCA